ncbi:hypothetical protein VUR80DRAFT_2349 [Thermomyces stellatus]
MRGEQEESKPPVVSRDLVRPAKPQVGERDNLHVNLASSLRASKYLEYHRPFLPFWLGNPCCDPLAEADSVYLFPNITDVRTVLQGCVAFRFAPASAESGPVHHVTVGRRNQRGAEIREGETVPPQASVYLYLYSSARCSPEPTTLARRKHDESSHRSLAAPEVPRVTPVWYYP